MSDPREPLDATVDSDPPEPDLDIEADDIDDPEPEPDPEPDGDVEPDPEPRRQSRRDDQRSWRDRARAAEAAVELLRNQQQQPRPQPQQTVDPAQQQRAIEAEIQRLSMLPPDEMVRGILSHSMTFAQQQANLVNLQAQQRADIARFDGIKASSPAANRLATQVEQYVSALHNQGVFNISREQIFYALYGQQVFERGNANGRRQQRDGARDVSRQTTRPGNARGDAPRGGGGRSQDAADLDLLRNTRIGDTL